ncbi:IclR family transcriptional regulator [Arthrobacter sp. I2-34]|uniref:IclR family transcriptional regulator n=1 Tax=Arthrobacter hankyongi TaxID=2904801 RepID=A0ABS9L2A1_9MICC|nr:IclR family transcriptional regulator [Arthrobacter hankyongi]MCG2620751.1 IclR family transcriptional regulator [Arthrobacter hankyongi]
MLDSDITTGKPQGAAASLLNGLTVLEAFSVAQRSLLGVTEISELVGLHKSTVSRMLTGLTEAGYVQRDDDTGRYRLGLGMIGLAGPLLAELDVRRAALPHLEELTQTTGETAAIAVWNGINAVVVEQTASPHQVKHSASIGTRYNRFASSSVRIFLAELPTEEAARLLSAGIILRDSYRGLDDPAHEHLAGIRELGFAVNDGETTFEEYGVSAPVRGYRGAAVGCITASAPRSRVQFQASQPILRDAVLQAAERVSARLGSRPAENKSSAPTVIVAPLGKQIAPLRPAAGVR